MTVPCGPDNGGRYCDSCAKVVLPIPPRNLANAQRRSDAFRSLKYCTHETQGRRTGNHLPQPVAGPSRDQCLLPGGLLLVAARMAVRAACGGSALLARRRTRGVSVARRPGELG